MAADHGQTARRDRLETGASVIDRMRSRSWIIRSITTPTSRQRPGKLDALVGFDEFDVDRQIFQGGERWIESLHMTDLQRQLSRGRDQG